MRVLVVDDERSMQEFLEIFLRREGHEVVAVGDIDAAVMALESDEFDVVISDLKLGDRSGIEVLRAGRELAPEAVFLMITAYATTDTAVEAMREGAYDYVTKPFKVDELRMTMEKALEKQLLQTENQRLRSELRSRSRDRTLVGNSPAMQRVYDLVDQVAQTKTNVLVCGESGTGKELIARAVHERSPRSEKPFVAINCGAIPENLLESELFGHVKGAFTGAVQNKAGLFEAAEKGTLFLDEIGELSGALQVKLLRAIQEKRIRRVGGTSDEAVDVRIVAATNQDLETMIAENRFREDLYYRLNVIQLTLPPLRERVEDVPLLVRHFIEKFSRELDRPVEGIDPGALDRLMAYPFPGNVRELENVIERAVTLTRGPTIGADSFPPSVLRPSTSPPVSRIPTEGVDLDRLLAEYEKGLLCEALEQAGGVKKRAAVLLGISFRSFRYRLEKLNLETPDSEG